MQYINHIWREECLKSSNYIMILTSVMLKDYREQIFYKYSEIKCNEIKINDEIINFITAFGGIKRTYKFFANAYITQDKHIICIFKYCNRFKIQPHRLRMSTNFRIVKTPIVYEFINDNSQKVA
jgi:hypothetical protein